MNEDIKESILLQYKRWTEKKAVTDFGGLQIKFLRKSGLIKQTLSEADEIYEQATKVHYNGNKNLLGNIIVTENDQFTIQDIARSITLRKWFKSLSDNNKDISTELQKIA